MFNEISILEMKNYVGAVSRRAQSYDPCSAIFPSQKPLGDLRDARDWEGRATNIPGVDIKEVNRLSQSGLGVLPLE